MELPDDAPKFPKLPFLAGDLLLVMVAGYIAATAGSPLPPAAIYTIAACVGVGALLAVIPFIVDYNRRQEALLADRQHALEALARTTTTAVEQASIAAGGLHEIAELAQRNLKLAEHLPQKLQERINDFSRVRDEAMAAELESLQQEVNTLRASEAEKLDSAADKMGKALAELTKLDGSLRKQVQAWQEAVDQAQAGLARSTAAALEAVQRQTAASLAALPSTARPTQAAPSQPSETRLAGSPNGAGTGGVSPEPVRSVAESATAGPTQAASPLPTARETPETDPAQPLPAPTPKAAGDPPRRPIARRRGPDAAASLLPGLLADEAPEEEQRPSSAAKPQNHHARAAQAGAVLVETDTEPRASADGATRLTVTAYIGIGNKLFVRGEGPGLSWDEGTPLQFVSIGKWRWENSKAATPVVLKLYKNDQVECTAVGEIHLAPGQQREVTAHF